MLKIAYHPIYQHPLPEGHRFPMAKYELIPKQLMHEGLIGAENLFEPNCILDEWILLTHELDYLTKLKNLGLSDAEMRKIGFPLSAQLIERELRITQGTIDCSLFALEFGVAMNVAGGTHHAFKDKGEGFCILNDMAVAANYLLHHQLAKHILIIDLDVHQGNGTASLFSQNPAVFTFSMHGKNNYPFFKEKSDMDIELQDGIDDIAYLTLLENHISTIIPLFKPDFIFYQAGVDVLSSDKFGKLNISQEGCAKRDRLIISKAYQQKIPFVITMGGGYSPKIADIVKAHCNTYKAALEIYF